MRTLHRCWSRSWVRAALAVAFLAALALPVLAANGTIQDIARINFAWCGAGQPVRSELWVGPDGSLGLQTKLPGERTALDLLPAETPPTQHALTELVLYSSANAAGFQRWNFSNMAGAHPQLRMASEAQGTGTHRGLWFAFDGEAGSTALEPFGILSPAGNNPGQNATNRLVIDPLLPAVGESGVWVFWRVGANPANVIGRKLKCTDPDPSGKRWLYIDQ